MRKIKQRVMRDTFGRAGLRLGLSPGWGRKGMSHGREPYHPRLSGMRRPDRGLRMGSLQHAGDQPLLHASGAVLVELYGLHAERTGGLRSPVAAPARRSVARGSARI